VRPDKLNRIGGIRTLPWEALHVGGTLLIDELLNAISRSDAAVYDVTDLNQNVLFELGYAVGAGEKIFPVLEAPVADLSSSQAAA
jgi:hypothetical protein